MVKTKPVKTKTVKKNGKNKNGRKKVSIIDGPNKLLKKRLK